MFDLYYVIEMHMDKYFIYFINSFALLVHNR